MLNRWQKKGDVTDIPRLTTTSVNNYTGSFSYTSTFYMRSGDYLKLKTLHLGYMLPSKMNKALRPDAMISINLSGRDMTDGDGRAHV